MRVTRALWQQRQPMIRFIGRRTAPQAADHTPKPHPESSLDTLPESFASYREKAIQHGPLKARQPSPSSSAPQTSSSPATNTPDLNSAATSISHPHGAIGGRSARELGPIRLNRGEVRDRSELPQRFHRTPWSAAEIEAIESGGASMFA